MGDYADDAIDAGIDEWIRDMLPTSDEQERKEETGEDDEEDLGLKREREK